MSDLNLDAIRARFAKVEAIAKEENPSEYRLVAVHAHSAMDVPKLLAEVERLCHEVFTLTNSEDARVLIVETERDNALLEVERLRAELTDARFGIEEGSEVKP